MAEIGGRKAGPDSFARRFARWLLSVRDPKRQDPVTPHLIKSWLPLDLLVGAPSKQCHLHKYSIVALDRFCFGPDLYLTILLRGETYDEAAKTLGMDRGRLRYDANSSDVDVPYSEDLTRYMKDKDPNLFDPRVDLESLCERLLRNMLFNAVRWLHSGRKPEMQAPHSQRLYRKVRKALHVDFERVDGQDPEVVGEHIEALDWKKLKGVLADGLGAWLDENGHRQYSDLHPGERWTLAHTYGRKLELGYAYC